MHEREENWVGAMSFLDYTKRALGWTIRAIIPGLSTNVYEQKEGDGAPRCEPKVPFVGANPSRKPDKPSLTSIERATPNCGFLSLMSLAASPSLSCLRLDTCCCAQGRSRVGWR